MRNKLKSGGVRKKSQTQTCRKHNTNVMLEFQEEFAAYIV